MIWCLEAVGVTTLPNEQIRTRSQPELSANGRVRIYNKMAEDVGFEPTERKTAQLILKSNRISIPGLGLHDPVAIASCAFVCQQSLFFQGSYNGLRCSN